MCVCFYGAIYNVRACIALYVNFLLFKKTCVDSILRLKCVVALMHNKLCEILRLLLFITQYRISVCVCAPHSKEENKLMKQFKLCASIVFMRLVEATLKIFSTVQFVAVRICFMYVQLVSWRER